MKNAGFLLDQMLDIDVAGALIDMGCDVARVADFSMEQAEDSAILAKAVEQDRVLLTLDGHFGDWAVLPLNKHSGVIRIRANPATTRNVLDVLLPFLRRFKSESFDNTLVIVSKTNIRWIKTGEW